MHRPGKSLFRYVALGCTLVKEMEWVFECIVTFQAKRKELAVLLNEENRRMRMRSVGNVRFIG